MRTSIKDRPWAFLTPDLLLDVSSRLHDAADFIRFNAVCTSWRDLPYSPATRPKFLPWLITQCNGQIMSSPVIRPRPVDISSKGMSSYQHSFHDGVLLAAATSECDGDRNWVASTDGRTASFFTTSPEPRLVDLVTGTVTPLPHFPNPHDDDVFDERMRNPHGIVYKDGTVFLYTFDNSPHRGYYCFMAAILRPGVGAWTVMQKMLNQRPGYNACAAYHGGKVLVWPNMHSLCTLTPDFQDRGDHDMDASELKMVLDGVQDDTIYFRYHGNVLECHGELLRASVLIKRDWYSCNNTDLSWALSVKVHALEKGPGNEMRWVVRDGSSLADRVLYLGTQASFSTDAAQLGICGGSAYFGLMDRVFRCSLVVDGEAEVMKLLPPRGKARRTHVWCQPQPTIAPIQKIRERNKNRSK